MAFSDILPVSFRFSSRNSSARDRMSNGEARPLIIWDNGLLSRKTRHPISEQCASLQGMRFTRWASSSWTGLTLEDAYWFVYDGGNNADNMEPKYTDTFSLVVGDSSGNRLNEFVCLEFVWCKCIGIWVGKYVSSQMHWKLLCSVPCKNSPQNRAYLQVKRHIRHGLCRRCCAEWCDKGVTELQARFSGERFLVLGTFRRGLRWWLRF